MGYDNQKRFELLFYKGTPQESDAMKNALRKCFTKMIQAQVDRPADVEKLLESMKCRIKAGGNTFENRQIIIFVF